MSHFPKKTVVTLGLLTAFLALPILGIPWAFKAYIFFFLGVGVAGSTYVAMLPRKRKDFVRRGKGMVTFPESTSQIIPGESSVTPEISDSSSGPKIQVKNFSSLRVENKDSSIRSRSKKHFEKEKQTLEK